MSDVSKTNELIAEADDHQAADLTDPDGDYCRNCGDAWPCVTRRLADALEAAARVPVQGEPNDDREALAAIVKQIIPDHAATFRAALVGELAEAGFSRATVPDAAPDGQVIIPTARIQELREAKDAATEELETLRDIAETHAFCADRLSIETERADRVAREVCDRGCSYTGGPDEECSAHGRNPRELWEFIAQDIVGRDAATARAEKAEAERDAATEALLQTERRDVLRFEDMAVDAMAERDAALAAVERVRAMVEEMGEAVGFDRLVHGSEAEYPVSYLRDKIEEALDGAPEPEVKP